MPDGALSVREVVLAVAEDAAVGDARGEPASVWAAVCNRNSASASRKVSYKHQAIFLTCVSLPTRSMPAAAWLPFLRLPQTNEPELIHIPRRRRCSAPVSIPKNLDLETALPPEHMGPAGLE
jgi:hypothetical protein